MCTPESCSGRRPAAREEAVVLAPRPRGPPYVGVRLGQRGSRRFPTGVATSRFLPPRRAAPRRHLLVARLLLGARGDIVYSSIALPLAERLCVQQGPQMTPTGGGYCRGEDRTARDRGLTLTLTHTPQRPFVAICAFVPRFPPDPVHPERTIPNFIPSYSRRAVRGKSTCLQSARPIPPFSKRAWRSSRASQRAPRKGARGERCASPRNEARGAREASVWDLRVRCACN